MRVGIEQDVGGLGARNEKIRKIKPTRKNKALKRKIQKEEKSVFYRGYLHGKKL